MRLTEASIDGFRGLRRRMHFAADDRLTVVTGRSGTGKTSVLEAIARHKEHVAPYFRRTRAAELSPTGSPVTIGTSWHLTDDERRRTGAPAGALRAHTRVGGADDENRAEADPSLVDALMRFAPRQPYAAVDLVPTSRLGSSARMPARDPSFEQRQMRLSDDPGKYNGLGALLATSSSERVDALRDLLETVLPDVALTGHDALGPRFGERRLRQLPASAGAVYPVVASLVLLGLQNSVVLFDTPELGLGPGEGLALLDALRAHAPSNQWIVATRDPDIVGQETAHVIDLDRESEGTA